MNWQIGQDIQVDLLARLPQQWLLPLVVVLIASGLFTLGRAYSRLFPQHKGRFIAVALLNIVAWFAIVMLLSPIQVKQSDAGQTVLVTSSALPISQGQFSAIDDSSNIWYTQAAYQSLLTAPWFSDYQQSQANILRQPEDIAWALPTLQHLIVLGDGLSPQQWQRLVKRRAGSASTLTVSSIDSPTLTGPVALNWQRQLTRGQWQQVSGALQVADNKDQSNLQQGLYHLQLKDPAGQVIEQQTLRKDEPFEFVFNAKTEGMWLYRLQLYNDLSQPPIADEPIAFEVIQPSIARLLIRQSAPSFETRHLKNWAVEQGAQVTVETQISQSRYISQHLNYPQPKPGNDSSASIDGFVSAQSLAQYDLVIIDGRGLIGLTESEQNNLQLAISQGLGLLVLADSNLLTSQNRPNWLRTIDISPMPADEPTQSLLKWQYYQAEQPIRLLPAQLSTQSGRALVGDTQGRTIVLASNYGLGQLAISLNTQSHQWQTSGQAALFSHYWHYLVEQLARPADTPFILPMPDDQLQLAQQPMTLCFTANEEIRQSLSSFSFSYGAQGTVAVPLQRDVDRINPNLACSPIYPSSPGWQHATLSNDDTQVSQGFYVYAPQDWLAWQQHNKRSAAKQFAAPQGATSSAPSWAPLPLWAFWWALVVSCTLLWIERKF